MKIKVIKEFRDKFDKTTIYKINTVIENFNTDRCKDLISRGLAKEIKTKTSKKK